MLLIPPAKVGCLRVPVDAAQALVDVAVLEDTVPDGGGAVKPLYTEQPPKQLITPVA